MADTMMISHESERMPNGWRKYYTIKGRGQGDIHISLELKFKKSNDDIFSFSIVT